MNDKTENFNVGDVVVNMNDVSLWNNIYHFEDFIRTFSKIEVVTQTAYGRFTTDKDIDLNKSEDLEDWRKQYSIYSQSSGKSKSGFKKMYNWTKNKDSIIADFEVLFAESFAKCQTEDEVLIARLEAEIREKQARIEKIRAGNRNAPHNSKVNQRDFINTQVEKIRKIFESF